MLGRLRNRKAKGGDRERERREESNGSVYISERFVSSYLMFSPVLYTLRMGREAVTRDTAQQLQSEITTLLTIPGPLSIPLISTRGAGDGSRDPINQQRPPSSSPDNDYSVLCQRPSSLGPELLAGRETKGKGTLPEPARPQDSIKENTLHSRDPPTGWRGGGGGQRVINVILRVLAHLWRQTLEKRGRAGVWA